MSHLQNSPECNEEASRAMSAYAEAASSCDGPQLMPFVRFNDSHLPSAFPSPFLAAHAAFCIKDGEAPQVPDYLFTGLDTPAAKSTPTPGGEHQPVDTGKEDSEQANCVKLFSGQAKSFQWRALRRAFEFQRLRGFEVKALSSPLVEYVLRSSLNDTLPSVADPSESTPSTGDVRSQVGQQTDVQPSDSLNNLLVSALVDASASASVSEAKFPASHRKGGTGKRKESQVSENPLLEDARDSITRTSVGIDESVSLAEAGSSDAPSTKKRRGLNTAAMRQKNLEQVSNECKGTAICLSQAACGQCSTENCNKDHDLTAFMKTRPDDLEADCVFFSRHGVCPYGCCCRFGRSHVDSSGTNLLRNGRPATAADLQKYQELRSSEELNVIKDHCKGGIASKYRRRLKADGRNAIQSVPDAQGNGSLGLSAARIASALEPAASASLPLCEPAEKSGSPGRVGSVSVGNEDLDPQELRRRFAAQVRGKTFLAPLTTVGNLPFRRLCTRLGADVTVSEMAVANSLVEGKPSELCLLRRHRTEKIFGIQLAAGFPDVASECGRLFYENGIKCDFIDLNIACPLDQLHRRFKAGSCMLEKPSAVESVVKSLMQSCPSVPVTVKVRTAHYGKRHQLHSSIGRLSRSGVAAIFAHGRTAQQRYSKSADWDYLSRCKELMAEDVLLVGCGDIFSSAEFQYREETAGMDALMIGRGALIKPWIFTEIKEKRLWDISASERLSFVKEFVNNGLEHWGSDRRGVATTRRFLLELLSFMHRYIPPPFLEFQPQLIHWRPSPFKGRSELEVKLSSSNPKDWVEISSMFLGPPPKGFTFVPKHKANAYYVSDA